MRLRKHGAEPSAADLEDVPPFDGETFRPIKKAVTVRIDADILIWLRAKGGHYQKTLNATLRDAMNAERG